MNLPFVEDDVRSLKYFGSKSVRASLPRLLFVSLIAVVFLQHAFAQERKISGDQWLNAAIPYPASITNTIAVKPPVNAQIKSLKAESVAGKLKFSFIDEAFSTNQTAFLYVSMDDPSRDFSRDWRRMPMIGRSNSYDAVYAVLHADVPVVYFVAIWSNAVPLQVSGPRVCIPRALGIEEPSKYFWPFLEGFEEGLDNWAWVNKAAGAMPLSCVTAAKNGEHCLKIALPAAKKSGVVGSSVLRSWHLVYMGGRGLRFWAKTGSGEGQVQLSLICHAGRANQTIFTSPKAYAFSNVWSKVEIPFVFLPVASYSSVDYCALEFSSNKSTEFYLDDVSLMGRWKMELE